MRQSKMQPTEMQLLKIQSSKIQPSIKQPTEMLLSFGDYLFNGDDENQLNSNLNKYFTRDMEELPIEKLNVELDKKNIICKNLQFEKYSVINKDNYNNILTNIGLDPSDNFLNNNICGKYISDKIYCKTATFGGNSKKLIKGGKTVFESITQDNLTNIGKYCKDYGETIFANTENTVIAAIANANLEKHLNTKEKEALHFLKTKLPDITEIIKDYYIRHVINYLIPIMRYDVESINIDQPLTDPKEYKQTINYFEFNKDIILDYQGDQLDLYEKHKEAFYKYIKEQNKYINSLSLSGRRIVKDYTRLKSFSLYQEYCKDTTDDKSKFIDSFKKYFKDQGENPTEIFTKGMSNAFADYIIAYRGITDKVRIDEILSKGYYDDADVIYDDIQDYEWKHILKSYLDDINFIINNAPPVIEHFICYRGVAFDYIQPESMTVGNNQTVIFNSTRSSSVSFNYFAAKEYHDKGDRNKILYKVLLAKGCKVLFATPLAGTRIIHEMELIVSSDHSFMAVGEGSWEVKETFNNISNKNNICYNEEDKIRTKKLILIPNSIMEHTKFEKLNEVISANETYIT
jgi:hypothetical protein